MPTRTSRTLDGRVFDLRTVSLRRAGRALVENVTLSIRPGERWIVLGANGSGKTSLLRILSTYAMPSSGSVDILGHRVGTVDVRELRLRIGYLSPSLDDMIEPDLTVGEIVDAAQAAALIPWYVPRASVSTDLSEAALASAEMLGHRDRRYGGLASGEKLRVQLARAMVANPRVLLLDEPTSHLDLRGRESLLTMLGDLGPDRFDAIVLVVHRVEDIPRGFTNLLMLRQGEVIASGELDATLSSASLSDCFGTSLVLERVRGRYVAIGDDGRLGVAKQRA